MNSIETPMPAGPVAEINLGAIRENYRMLKRLASGAEASAVVKCNAYGAGMAETSIALSRHEACNTFFVAYAQEGAELRAAIDNDAVIFVFSGPLAGTIPLFRDYRLTPIINSVEQAKAWSAAMPDAPCALHADTGMNRLGAPLTALSAIKETENLNITLFMSHLACSSNPANEMNEHQRALFENAATNFPGIRRSLAASGGAMMDASYCYDLIRPGVALFGGSPFDTDDQRLKPVVTLKAPIVQLRDVLPGETVGYSATFIAKKPTRLAVAAIGYGDGVPFNGSNIMEVAIHGIRAKIAGRVSMDFVCIDVTDCAGDISIGDEVELFGANISVFDAARSCGTHAYELLTRLGGRINRRYV